MYVGKGALKLDNSSYKVEMLVPVKARIYSIKHRHRLRWLLVNNGHYRFSVEYFASVLQEETFEFVPQFRHRNKQLVDFYFQMTNFKLCLLTSCEHLLVKA